MADHATWTNRIIRLFDKALALLEQRDIKINGKSPTELRRQLAQRRPSRADEAVTSAKTNPDKI